MESPRWASCTPDFVPRYQEFAAQQFGTTAYQACPEYLDWMYAENPFGGCPSDGMLALNDAEQVIGCVHRLRVPWRINGERVVVPAIHNLMVEPAHRQGVGGILAVTSIRSEPFGIVPGVVEPIAEIYRKIGCHLVPSQWFRRVLKPLTLGLQLGAKKLLGTQPTPKHFPIESVETQLPSSVGRGWLRFAPTDAQLAELAALFQQQQADAAGPDWSVDFLRWRFFHAKGPRHAVVCLEQEGRLTDAALISLGPRHGVNVGRIVAAVASDPVNLRIVVRLVEHVVRQHGGTVLLAYSASPALQGQLASLGWQPMANGPQTYFHRRGKKPIPPIAFNGEAGDLGLEAIAHAA